MMHATILLVLFGLPFLGTAYVAAHVSEIPWVAAGIGGYLISLFIGWCFDKES